MSLSPPAAGLRGPMGLERALSDAEKLPSTKNADCLFQRVSCHREAAVQPEMAFATHWLLDGGRAATCHQPGVSSRDVSLLGQHVQPVGVSPLCFLFPFDTYRKCKEPGSRHRPGRASESQE